MGLDYGNRTRYRPLDLVLYLVGVVGLTACLTMVFLSMRAVMNIGGFCAEGGPYVIETPCPEGVPLVMITGIFGLFVFGGLMAWKGTLLGGPYGVLVGLAWPALFLSLGWNFLEFAVRPPQGEGIVLGWLIPGVLFVIMGGLPLVAVLPFGNSGRAAGTRTKFASRIAPRGASFVRSDAEGDLVTRLERLASLRTSGALTDDEFERVKRALLREADG